MKMTGKKSAFSDFAVITMVVLMSIAANLPTDIDVGFDRRYLLAGLIAIVVVALIKYLTFTFVLVVAILAIGANLPANIAAELGIDKNVMMFALVAMVIISLANQIFKLPLGVTQTEKTKRTSNTHGAAALYSAISKGRLPTVRALLDQGVSANIRTSDGQTPLIYASAKGYSDVIQLLLAHGADVAARRQDNKTALKIATEMGYTRVADLLKGAGATE